MTHNKTIVQAFVSIGMYVSILHGAFGTYTLGNPCVTRASHFESISESCTILFQIYAVQDCDWKVTCSMCNFCHWVSFNF